MDAQTYISTIFPANIIVYNIKWLVYLKDIAREVKSSIGWFYGFKLYLVINDRDEILYFCLTPGNTDDRNPQVIGSLTKNISGKLFADKGYVTFFETCSKNTLIHILLPILC